MNFDFKKKKPMTLQPKKLSKFSHNSEISHKIKGCCCTPSKRMRQTLEFTAGQSIVEIYSAVKGGSTETYRTMNQLTHTLVPSPS